MKSKNNLEKRLQFYVNQQEIKAIQAEFEASGYNSLSTYLRKKIAGNGIIIPYPKEMIDKLDRLGIQQKRMGNNINQIAKKVHLFNKEGRFPIDTMELFNKTMIAYIHSIKDLSKAYRSFIRKFS